MKLSEPATSTHSSVLHIEFTVSGGRRDVSPVEVINLLESIKFTGRLANGIALPRWESPSLHEIKTSPTLEPPIIGLRYGSPFEAAIQLAEPVLETVAAVSAVIYTIKRLWKLPTELRTHSQEVEAKFLEAETKATLAKSLRDEVQETYRRRDAMMGSSRRHAYADAGEDVLNARLERLDTQGVANREKRKRDLWDLDAENGWPQGTILQIEELPTPSWVGRSASWLDEDDVDWSSFSD